VPELKLSPAGRRYGYFKNPVDIRDFGVAKFSFKAATAPSMNNGQFMGPVLDQGQQGSCTAHAGVGDREFLHWKQIAALGQPVNPGSTGLFSPSFLYFLERQIDAGWTGGVFLPNPGDVGSTGRTSCQVLRTYGCDTRAEMPYSDSDFSTAPTAAQMQQATQWPTGQYHFLTNIDDMKSVIASGYNFRVGFTVYESFESIGSSGIWTPSTSEQVLGGHEVLAYGYDDTVNGGSFLIRNSWAADWGKNGDFYMRYVDAANSNILMDACIQHLGVWSKPS
jgi:C1A family cysteine protease